jgi:flavin-binding protein dodecin
MAVLKVIEVLASSEKSWENAAENALKHASKSIKNIKSLYVNEQNCVVGDDGKIKEYRMNCKITFVVK